MIKDIEESPGATAWGSKMALGTLLAEFGNSPSGGGWIHSVAFAPDGARVAWVAHDSSITVADPKGSSKLLTEHLPFKCVQWLGNTSLVAAVSTIWFFVLAGRRSPCRLASTVDQHLKVENTNRNRTILLQRIQRNWLIFHIFCLQQ